MPPAFTSQRARECVETLAIASAGGLGFGLAGVPAGYVSGSILAVALTGLAGRPSYVPPPLTRAVLFVLGVVLGSAVTPETLRGMATWPLSIVVTVIALMLVMVLTTAYLRAVHGWDRLTALLASSPGALSQVVAYAISTNANVPAVVITQTLRIVLLAIGTPLVLWLFGHEAHGGFFLTPAQSSWSGIVVLLGACLAVSLGLHWLGFPGGMIFGAMLMSSILHGSGLVEARLPGWAGIVAMIGVGATTGSRFRDTNLRLLLRYLGAALGAFAVMVSVTTVAVLVVIAIFPFNPADVALAYSPGAQEAMMILVLALSGDPVFVGAHHIARFFVISSILPMLVRMAGGKVSKQTEERISTRASPND